MEEKIIKLCKCGCGEPVAQRRDGTYNDFINHHAIRLNNPAKKESFKERMKGENNPAKRPEVREKISQSVKGKNTGDSNHMRQEKYRKMFSILMSGKNNPMYGRKGNLHPCFGKTSPLKGIPISEEIKKKISESHKGRKKTEAHKRKISETFKDKKISNGENNPFFGKTHNPESILKMSQLAKNRFKNKENHPSWMGGVSFEPYDKNFDKKLKQYIRSRDKNICQNPHCNKKMKKNGDVHHIDYNKRNSCENNLINLCKSCHVKTNTSREYWKLFYQEIMTKKVNAIDIYLF